MLVALFLLPSLVNGFTNTLNPLPEYKFEWTADAILNKLSVQITLTPPGGTKPTVGWVGFGIAGGGGGMLGGDVFTAYSTGASTCALQDRLATIKALPVLDTDAGGFSDWTIDSCSKNGNVFTVAASRPFVTFDAQDLDFVTGPMTLLFAWGQTTPTSASTIAFHDGGYTPLLVSLWGEQVPVFNPAALESDHDVFTIPMPGVTIGQQTTYTCFGFNLTQKNSLPTQAIVFEPFVTQGHEPYVHHMVLYTCPNPVGTAPFSCFNMPTGCQIVYAWGKGGGPLILPPVTGIDIGSGSRFYAALQIHYNNLDNVPGLVDASGVKVYRTNMLRNTSSGFYLFGTMDVNLPPGKNVFSIAGKCPASWTSTKVPQSGVTIYSSFLHQHQRGRRIWTNVVRNGTTIATIGNNQNYDFNLQKVQLLSPFVKLLPGDELMTYCSYNTSNETSVIGFGEATTNEMCFNFVAYYPIQGSNPTSSCFPPPPACAGHPGSTSCSLLPGHPPAAYTVNNWVTSDAYFFSGGSISCSSGFAGTPVLGCAGYGAPFTFSGCSRAPTASATPTAAPSAPTAGAPSSDKMSSAGFVPSLSAVAAGVSLISLYY